MSGARVHGLSVIAVIPARSGSKGFPNKNLAQLGGCTLLELAVQVAKDSTCVDDAYVSTDSKKYADIGFAAGALIPGLRSERLSGDTVQTVDVVIDLLESLNKKYEYLILLQPTSPVREPLHLEEALAMLMEQDIDAVVSVEHMDEPHPEKVKRIDNFGRLVSYIDGASSETPRQQLPKAYLLNGAIYAIKTAVLMQQKTFLPPRTSAYQMPRGVNVDSEVDYMYLKMLYEMGLVKIHGLSHK